MDSFSEVAAANTQAPASVLSANYSAKDQSNSLVIDATLGSSSASTDQVSVSFEDLYKGLSIAGKTVIDKLNEILKAKLPNGIQSLKPEDVTSEATADRIAMGATSFFHVFATQNSNLQGEELLNKFMETIRGGIKKGYDAASATLEGVGAYQFDGVKQGVDETMGLVEKKLQQFEAYMREQMGLQSTQSDAATQTAQNVEQAVLTQAGAKTLSVAA